MLEITFHRSLYHLGAIEEAAAAYGRLGTFNVAAEDNVIRVSISDIDDRAKDRIEDAFCNHVLFDTIRRARPSAEELTK